MQEADEQSEGKKKIVRGAQEDSWSAERERERGRARLFGSFSGCLFIICHYELCAQSYPIF